MSQGYQRFTKEIKLQSPMQPTWTSINLPPLPTPATPYGPIKGMPSSVNSGILPIIYKDPLISNNTACCLPNSPPYLSLYNFRVPKPYTAIPTTLPTADSLDTTDRITERPHSHNGGPIRLIRLTRSRSTSSTRPTRPNKADTHKKRGICNYPHKVTYASAKYSCVWTHRQNL